MKRTLMPKTKDRKIFKRTAMSGKRINNSPVLYRGGIRL